MIDTPTPCPKCGREMGHAAGLGECSVCSMLIEPKPWGQELGSDPAKWPVGRAVLVLAHDGGRALAALRPADANQSPLPVAWEPHNSFYLVEAYPEDRWMEWPQP